MSAQTKKYTRKAVGRSHNAFQHTHTQQIHLTPTPIRSPFPSFSFQHPSLSAAMECETNSYHYTLQVKKGSWECVIYAGFDFYVGSTGSSIIAPLGTLVHRAPDEMLSWHHYQSPRACPSLVPDVLEGGMCCSCRSPCLLPATRSVLTVFRHLSCAFRACVRCLGPCMTSAGLLLRLEKPVFLMTGYNWVVIVLTVRKTRLVYIHLAPLSDSWVGAIMKI